MSDAWRAVNDKRGSPLSSVYESWTPPVLDDKFKVNIDSTFLFWIQWVSIGLEAFCPSPYVKQPCFGCSWGVCVRGWGAHLHHPPRPGPVDSGEVVLIHMQMAPRAPVIHAANYTQCRAADLLTSHRGD